MMVDSAAKDIKMKKQVPHTLPPAMLLNTFGKVINSRDGPASGCTPYAKHAGIMINPAINATNVSRITIFFCLARNGMLPLLVASENFHGTDTNTQCKE